MQFLNEIFFTPEYCLTDKYLFAIVLTVFLGMNSDTKSKKIVICKLKTMVKLNPQGFLDKEICERLLSFPVSNYMHLLICSSSGIFRINVCFTWFQLHILSQCYSWLVKKP